MAAFPLPLCALAFFFLSFSPSAYADIEAYYQSDYFESGGAGKFPSQRFKSSQAIAPTLNFLQYEPPCRDGLYTFIAPRGGGVMAPGPMILDQDGHLIWTKNYGQTYNMDMQMYKGEPYLTFWTGDDSIVGHGKGTYYLVSWCFLMTKKIES